MSLLLALQGPQAAALEGTALLVISTAGALDTEIRLVGDALLALNAAGVLTTEIRMVAEALLVLAATADLTAPGGGAAVFRKLITVLEALRSDVSRG